KTFPCDGSDAVYFYTRDVPAGEKPLDLQARMFHPGASGLSEDPATGSATAAAAPLLADLASVGDGELNLRIGQGLGMGPPALLAPTEDLHLRCGQVLHAHPVAILDDLRDPLPVAMSVVALVAEDADRSRFLHQRRQLVEFFLCLRRLQVLRIDPVQRIERAA